MLTPACYPSLGQYDAASRTDDQSQLTDEQWFLIEDLFPWEPPTWVGGRPPIPPRASFEALLWMLRNGGPWEDLPKYFPSESTCRRRLREWTETGILAEVWSRLVELSDELGWVNWEQLIADGTFCRATRSSLSADRRNAGIWSESAAQETAVVGTIERNTNSEMWWNDISAESNITVESQHGKRKRIRITSASSASLQS